MRRINGEKQITDNYMASLQNIFPIWFLFLFIFDFFQIQNYELRNEHYSSSQKTYWNKNGDFYFSMFSGLNFIARIVFHSYVFEKSENKGKKPNWKITFYWVHVIVKNLRYFNDHHHSYQNQIPGFLWAAPTSVLLFSIFFNQKNYEFKVRKFIKTTIWFSLFVRYNSSQSTYGNKIEDNDHHHSYRDQIPGFVWVAWVGEWWRRHVDHRLPQWLSWIL